MLSGALLTTLLLAALPQQPAAEQPVKAPPGMLGSSQVIEEIFKAIAASDASEMPTAKQVSAPAVSAASPSAVDRASFPELFGLAVDSGLLNVTDGAVTISANPFGFLSVFRPDVVDRQSLYEQYEGLRRFGGAMTLGGKGEKFDRDGDGTEDEPLTSSELGDIITFEFKYRLWGTRDRRDPSNAEQYFDRTKNAAVATDKRLQAIVMLMLPFQVKDATGTGWIPETAVRQVFALPQAQAHIQAIRQELSDLKQAMKEANAVIDRRMIWTVVVGGTQQKPEFGRDRWTLGLRGQGARGLLDHTVNVDWSRVDALTVSDPTVFKAGYKMATKILRDSALTKDGAALSLDAAFERYWDVPDAEYNTVVKVGATLEFPVGGSAKVPLSATYVNHPDLLTGVKGWVGHIGLAWDLSPLKALTKGEGAAKDR